MFVPINVYLIVFISSSFHCFLFAACICAYIYLNTWPGTSVVLFVLIKLFLSIHPRQICLFFGFPVERSIDRHCRYMSEFLRCDSNMFFLNLKSIFTIASEHNVFLNALVLTN